MRVSNFLAGTIFIACMAPRSPALSAPEGPNPQIGAAGPAIPATSQAEAAPIGNPAPSTEDKTDCDDCVIVEKEGKASPASALARSLWGLFAVGKNRSKK